MNFSHASATVITLGGRPCLFAGGHWGTFKLTDEPMDEPPARTRQAYRPGASAMSGRAEQVPSAQIAAPEWSTA